MAAAKVAAQIRPPLARYLARAGTMASRAARMLGKIQRDCRRWLVPKLREADDGRAQVAPAGAREVAIAGKPVDDSLQRRRRGGLGKGIGLHGFAPQRTPEVRGEPGRTGGDIRELSYSANTIFASYVYSR